MKCYVDSNVFILAFTNQDEFGIRARQILDKIAKQQISAITSFLTYDEFYWGIKRFFDRQHVLIYTKNFLEIPNLQFIPVDGQIIYTTQHLLEKYPLAPRDAIHAATCIISAAAMVSNDPDFNKVKELKRIQL